MKPSLNLSYVTPRRKPGTRSVLMAAALAVFFLPAAAEARDKIHIVGSSTVYPFTTAVAEEFGKTTSFSSPIVEATGTGGGIKLLCGGMGENFPDMANASRAIKDSERKMCADNGVADLTEVKIGYDGIVLANSKDKETYSLSKEQIFAALAKQVPDASGKLVNNPNVKWSDIDPVLPAVKIEIYGPPTTSGTRDAFVELVMEKACADKDAFKKAWPEEDARKKNCHLMREDGHYIESGENDNLIVQKLRSNPQSLGIFGFSFLEQNMDTLHGSLIDGVTPTFEGIADGSYPVSRPLFVYAKNGQADITPGMSAFLQELVSEKAAGEDGYLAAKGLIPLPEDELAAMQKSVADAFPKKK